MSAGVGRSLRIAVLASGLRVGGGVAVGLNMLRGLGRVAPQHTYLCIVPRGLGYPEAVAELPQREVIEHEHRGMLRRWRFETLEVPRAVRAFAPDAILALGGRGLHRPGCVQAAFPQDPHFYYPSRHFGRELLRVRLKKWYHRRHFARQLQETQLVLVQTEVVARRLREQLGYRGEVFVCATAVSPELRAGRTGRPMPEPLRGLGARFKLLYPTRYYAHKNLEGAVRMFREHGRELRDCVLITTLAPDQHGGAPRFLRQLDDPRVRPFILNVGPQTHEQVLAYYEHCDALFMPTLLETFGIPYLEAMCLEVPILTSDLDFAHAVCDNAAIYFDPWDTAAMKDAIHKLAESGVRERLCAAGRARAATAFPGWDEIAGGVATRLTALVEARASADGSR